MKVTATFQMNVTGGNAAALSLTPNGGNLADAAVGIAVQDELVTTVSGGQAPYEFAVTNGALPDGLELNAVQNPDGSVNVVLDGTPTTAGSSVFDLSVTDASGAVATASLKRKIS